MGYRKSSKSINVIHFPISVLRSFNEVEIGKQKGYDLAGSDEMNISKAKLNSIIQEFPDDVDIEEVMYRLYLLHKIESGEADVKSGNMMTHVEAVERLSKKWQN